MTRRALLSVYDKTGILEFGRALVEGGWEILSTGGTARALREAGVEVTDVSEATGHPEMMEGRVKTLHPAIHAGLLARRDKEEDLEALEAQGYAPIDLVAVNLYPFRETVARPDVTLDEAMAQLDIGGPTMLRSAAKNHGDVWVVVDPADYGAVLDGLDGDVGPQLRRSMAAKVFAHVSEYDAAVAAYLEGQGESTGTGESMPESRTVQLERVEVLRYGENPGQEAAFYRPVGSREGLAGLEQLHGKALSYNNLLDLDGALLSLAPFAFTERPAVCIVKHTTPCGLAVADTQLEAYRRALRTDPVSAFGSVIALNRPADEDTAAAISELFVECVVAPSFSPGALETLTQKKNIRLLTYANGDAPEGKGSPTERFLSEHGKLPEPVAMRSVYGGMLAQTPPVPPFYGCVGDDWTVATERAPDEAEWNDLKFAWAAVFAVKSNAILLARDGSTLGIGAGQMSRVDSSRIAVQKAADAGMDLTGCVLASDAFFPFRDGVDAAAAAGVKAIVQPGGSIRDEEVIAAADGHGIAMVFTGQRLFRH
ncbi:MAG: bifunctional phosphoribosylaminoimidazolecarboxamide formyltransferase/IMP cyclohydrolase [Gemmatimonadetes bacterium]|nr:bifunctional phosphoribosylaminoimidazolecarboxamide formyltransferase/IMP cyclohydrolase [Gemmatimonadota bacterium]